MIKKPWPNEWTPPPRIDNCLKHYCCPYNKAYNLPCGTKRVKCKKCYIKQLNMCENAQEQLKVKVKHKCEACGGIIHHVDKAVWVEVTSREPGHEGEVIARKEVCVFCKEDLIKWLNGEEE